MIRQNIGHHYSQTFTKTQQDMHPPTNNWREKTKRTLFLCGNRNGHHYTELRT
jgi:hypothetical protein